MHLGGRMDAYRQLPDESLTVKGVPFADAALVEFLAHLDLEPEETMYSRGFHIEDPDNMAITRMHGTTMDPKDALRYAGRSPLEGYAEGKPRYGGRSLDYTQPYREVWIRWTEPEPPRRRYRVVAEWETTHGRVQVVGPWKIYTGVCQAPWCGETFTLTRSCKARDRGWNPYCSDDCKKEVKRVKARERKRRQREREAQR